MSTPDLTDEGKGTSMITRHSRSIVAAAAAALMVAGAAVAQAGEAPLPEGTTRLAGADRYATSAAISAQSFTSPVDTVFVASGTAFPDALAGGPAAARLGGPVLLVDQDRVPTAIKEELARLAPKTIYVLGGSSAVSSAVVDDLTASTSATVRRVSGTDRYATATAVSKRVWSSADTVFLASGATYADALSGGAAAAHRDAPLLLSASGSLTNSTRAELERLKPSKVYVLGGGQSLSSQVVEDVRAAVPGVGVTRLAGLDRYGTAVRIADAIWPDGSDAMFFASAHDFPDALSGTPAAHVNDAPVLLTRDNCLTTASIELRIEFDPATLALLGGTEVVPDGTANRECGANRYFGTSDRFFPIHKPGGATEPALVTIEHKGTGEFKVVAHNEDLGDSEILVDTTGPYTGTALMDEGTEAIESSHMRVTANGPWTIRITSISDARTLSTGLTSGSSDDVFKWDGTEKTVKLTKKGSGHIVVWAFDQDGNHLSMLVNTNGTYDRSMVIPEGTRFLTIESARPWSITVP